MSVILYSDKSWSMQRSTPWAILMPVQMNMPAGHDERQKLWEENSAAAGKTSDVVVVV